MTYSLAGKFGPEAVVVGTPGHSAVFAPSGQQAHVYLPGTTTAATVYTDETRTVTAANPVTLDGNGNLVFYADPGKYDVALTVNGTTITLPVTVLPHPLDMQPDLALRPFRAALAGAQRGKNRCVVATIGDSKTEGQNADAGATYADTWPRYLLSALRAAYQPAGVAGGDGYIPSRYQYSAPTGQGFTLGGVSGTDYTTGYQYGIGSRAIGLRTTSGTATITKSCTSFDVHFFNNAAGTKFTVTVDGGAPTTVTSGSTIGPAKWSSAALAAGNHTIVLAWATGSADYFRFSGCNFYNGDETSGVALIDAARSGADTSFFLTNWASFTPALNYTSPDLVILRLGTNDYSTHSSALFQSNLTALLYSDANSLKNKLTKTPGYLLLLSEPRGDTMTEPYANYVKAAYAAVAACTGMSIAVLEMGARMPTDSAADPLGLIGSDGLHETSKGYQFVAHMVYRALATL